MSLERRVISFLTGCMTTPVSIRTAIYIDQTTTMLIALICAILFIADIGIHTQIAFVAVLVDIHHCSLVWEERHCSSIGSILPVLFCTCSAHRYVYSNSYHIISHSLKKKKQDHFSFHPPSVLLAIKRVAKFEFKFKLFFVDLHEFMLLCPSYRISVNKRFSTHLVIDKLG